MDFPPELQKLILLHISNVRAWCYAGQVCKFWCAIVRENIHTQLVKLMQWNPTKGQFCLDNGMAHGLGYKIKVVGVNKVENVIFYDQELVYMYNKLICRHYYTLNGKYSFTVYHQYESKICNTITYWPGPGCVAYTWEKNKVNSYVSIQLRLMNDNSILISIYTRITQDGIDYINASDIPL